MVGRAVGVKRHFRTPEGTVQMGPSQCEGHPETAACLVLEVQPLRQKGLDKGSSGGQIRQVGRLYDVGSCRS